MSAGPRHRYEVISSEVAYVGRVTSVRQDVVRMPDGVTSQRDVVVHPGAVAVVAMDDDRRILLVRQYRHPVGGPLWELPAGLLDVEGESASAAAARELAEEGQLRAARWDVLVDTLTSPGMTDEAVRVFLARDLSGVPTGERHLGEHEEVELAREWIAINDAVRLVMSGELRNGICVAGVLATAHALAQGFAGLRAASHQWPDRSTHQG